MGCRRVDEKDISRLHDKRLFFDVDLTISRQQNCQFQIRVHMSMLVVDLVHDDTNMFHFGVLNKFVLLLFSLFHFVSSLQF